MLTGIFAVVSCGKGETTTEGSPTANSTTFIIDSRVDHFVNLQDLGVLPTNSPKVNKANLQKAIDLASTSGAALYLPPEKAGYPVSGGIILRKGVTIFGSGAPSVGQNTDAGELAGSYFVIRDRNYTLMTLESATRLSKLGFYYPDQSLDDPSNIVRYFPVLKLSSESASQGVTLTDLTFCGEYETMNFKCDRSIPCEQILVENCRAYPVSGKFISIDCCYDIPRVLHCSVDPSVGGTFGRKYSKAMLEKVSSTKNFAYWFDNIDNLVLMDLKASCVYGGIYIGHSTYGQLTGFSFQAVRVGMERTGDAGKNRTWEIMQGSINANLGSYPEDIHPIILKGSGITFLTNISICSKPDYRLPSSLQPEECILIAGSEPLDVTLTNVAISGYMGEFPIVIDNANAKVRARSCIDKNGDFFDYGK